jgi:uncharacterized protein (TIGR00255 family)
MLKSMTGFGRVSLPEAEWTQTWEIRSVNSRYLDLKWRLPFHLRCMEPRWSKVVQQYGSRGRVDITLQLRLSRPDALDITLNVAQAQAMLAELNRLAEQTGVEFKPDLNRLMGLGSLWEDELREPDERLTGSLEQGLRLTLEDWNASRETEGHALGQDLGKRLIRLEEWLTRIVEEAPRVKEEKFETLRGRMQTFLERFALEPDPDRLMQEAAMLSDKLDVTEELTRLRSHLDQIRTILDEGRETGKRLDFSMQECFREINTCGNKAQDSQVSRLTVDFKAELEKCREQIQNLE